MGIMVTEVLETGWVDESKLVHGDFECAVRRGCFFLFAAAAGDLMPVLCYISSADPKTINHVTVRNCSAQSTQE